MKHRIVELLLVLGLAGCAAQGDLAGTSRSITVDAGVTPAAASLTPGMQNLLQSTSPSYVTLIVHKQDTRSVKRNDALPDSVTSGSGFVIDKAGHVMTAGHVAVKSGYLVDARDSTGRVYQGRVVSVKKDNDMALVRLTKFNGQPVKPAASACMDRGEPIFSLGKPHARGDTARIGQLVSMSFGRQVSYDGFGYPDAMVLRMSTQKGESGGPVFNARGELTGMVVSTLSDGNGQPLNLAHALPSSAIARLLCSKTDCSPQWRALASQSSRGCAAPS